MMPTEPSFRRPTSGEQLLLQALLSRPFDGREELLSQLPHIVVRSIDDNGSLEIKNLSAIRAKVERRVPTEGEATDSDEITIHFLVHVVNGSLAELEVFKEDSSSVRTRPDPRSIVLPT